MRKMKDSGIEWIGMIPEAWNASHLKEQVFLKGDKTSERSFVVALENVESFTGKYIETESIFEGDGIKFGCDDILFGKLRPYLAKVYLAKSCGQAVGDWFVLSPKKTISHKYLASLLRSNMFIDLMTSSTRGAKMPRVAWSFMGTSIIPLPPPPEQQRIADYLDSKCAKIDDTIEKQRVVIEKLKAYKQSVITHAVTKGLNPNAPMKDSGIEWIGKIPEHWTVLRMKYLGVARNGLTYKPEDCVDEGQGTLVLRSSNILDGKLVLTNNVYVNASISESLMVKKSDILICSRNGSRSLIGKNALIGENTVASFGAFMMIFRSEYASYVHKILNSQVFSFYLSTFLTLTINQLTLGNFNNMKVVFCSDREEQRQIVDYLDKKCADIDTAIAKKEALIEKLAAYMKSLIYECVTGKREVV